MHLVERELDSPGRLLKRLAVHTPTAINQKHDVPAEHAWRNRGRRQEQTECAAGVPVTCEYTDKKTLYVADTNPIKYRDKTAVVLYLKTSKR